MNLVNRDALPKGTKLQGGKFVIDRLFSDQGGFSLIYEGKAIRKVEDDFFGTSRVNIIEEDVIIKELYFRDKAERREGQTALTWHPKDSNDKELIQTFKEKTRSEAEKLARLADKTPYIIVIYAAFEENNTVYLITKKIEGAKDFRSIIKGDKSKGIAPEKLDLNTCLRYILNVCEALKVVHNNNIIHLDIKPSNILRDNKDNAILIDFGISVSVGEGEIKTLLDGAISRHYSPPEQGSKDKKNIGFYSDIYALGATMYFFFTGGHLPPEYGDLISSGETFLPPSHYNDKVSDYLDNVVIKCLSLSFRDRYQTMEELIRALKGEEKYNTLVAKAHKALTDKEFDKGIEAIVATEALIPLNMELHGLKHDLQRGREEEQKNEEKKSQYLKVESLIAQHHYKKAIELLQLLPESADVRNKIIYCENQLLQQQLTQLLADAAHYEGNLNYQKALDNYLEAKKLKQNDNEINSKIESLGLLIAEMKMRKDIDDALNRFENKQLSFEELKVAIEEYLQKHPNDSEVTEKWKALQAKKTLDEKESEAKYLQYLGSAMTAKSIDSALDWLRKIPPESHCYEAAQQKISDINEQITKEEQIDETIVSENNTNNQDIDTTKLVSSSSSPILKLETTPSTDAINDTNKQKAFIDIALSEHENRQISFEQLKVVVEEYLQKHPNDSEVAEKWEILQAKNVLDEKESEAKHLEYLEKAQKAMTKSSALYWLRRIPCESHYYEEAQQYMSDLNKSHSLEKDKHSKQTIVSENNTSNQDDGATELVSSTPSPTAKSEVSPSSNTAHASTKQNENDKRISSESNYKNYNTGKLDPFTSLKKRKKIAFWVIGILLLLFIFAKMAEHVNSFEYVKSEAEKGDSDSMYNLGVMYHNGQEVTQDYAKAKEWFEKAVEKGNTLAMLNLGVLYENGQGVTQDLAKAKEWYSKAAKLGNESAQKALENLGATW